MPGSSPLLFKFYKHIYFVFGCLGMESWPCLASVLSLSHTRSPCLHRLYPGAILVGVNLHTERAEIWGESPDLSVNELLPKGGTCEGPGCRCRVGGAAAVHFVLFLIKILKKPQAARAILNRPLQHTQKDLPTASLWLCRGWTPGLWHILFECSDTEPGKGFGALPFGYQAGFSSLRSRDWDGGQEGRASRG